MDVPELINPTDIFAYNDVSCALTDNGLVCWGDDSDGLLAPYSLNASTVELGRDHACLIENQNVKCWGYDYRRNTQPPELRNPIQLAIGDFHSCALTANEGVVCWG